MRTKKDFTIQDAANMPAFRSENRGFIGFGFAVLYCGVATWCVVTFAQTIQPGAPYPVGMKQLEYVDPSQSDRHLALTLFYPAERSPW
jgi:hypothetical protein